LHAPLLALDRLTASILFASYIACGFRHLNRCKESFRKNLFVGFQMLELSFLESLVVAIDGGLLVLSLLVQMIIYPAFRYIEKDQFTTYHLGYTKKITRAVAPLMIMQLLLHGFFLVQSPGPIAYLDASFVLMCWGVTGVWAVPAHAKLGWDGISESLISRILSANLIRTILWAAVLLLTLIRF
jgi:hypothetical protein